MDYGCLSWVSNTESLSLGDSDKHKVILIVFYHLLEMKTHKAFPGKKDLKHSRNTLKPRLGMTGYSHNPLPALEGIVRLLLFASIKVKEL